MGRESPTCPVAFERNARARTLLLCLSSLGIPLSHASARPPAAWAPRERRKFSHLSAHSASTTSTAAARSPRRSRTTAPSRARCSTTTSRRRRRRRRAEDMKESAAQADEDDAADVGARPRGMSRRTTPRCGRAAGLRVARGRRVHGRRRVARGYGVLDHARGGEAKAGEVGGGGGGGGPREQVPLQAPPPWARGLGTSPTRFTAPAAAPTSSATTRRRCTGCSSRCSPRRRLVRWWFPSGQPGATRAGGSRCTRRRGRVARDPRHHRRQEAEEAVRATTVRRHRGGHPRHHHPHAQPPGGPGLITKNAGEGSMTFSKLSTLKARAILRNSGAILRNP